MKRLVVAVVCFALSIVLLCMLFLMLVTKDRFIVVDAGSYVLFVNEPVSSISDTLPLSAPDITVGLLRARRCTDLEPVPVIDFYLGSVRYYVQRCKDDTR